MRVVSGLAAMRNKEKLKMTFKRLAVAFGLAGALALAAASPTLAKTKHKKAPPAGAAETVEPGLAYGAHTGVYQAQNSASEAGETSGHHELPGYSARPKGMCWVRGGGGGSDLTGDWEACAK